MDPFEVLTRDEYESVIKKITKCEKISIEELSLKHGSELEIFFRQDDQVRNVNLIVQTLESPVDVIFDEIRNNLHDFEADITPKLYYTKANVRIYEDVADFQNFRKDFFDLEHLQCVLETLAQMHAASLALEEVKSKELGRKFRLDEEYDLPQGEGGDSNQKFRRTLCHNNLLSKNIKFKYGKCKLINFTSACYGVPISDVLQVVFFNTTEDLRQYHFHSLLEYYYDFLDQELKKHHLKIAHLFPKEDLQLAVHQLLPSIKQENPQLISKEDCYLIIKNKFGTTNYKFLSFQVTPLSHVSGFLGEYHKLEIKIDYQGEEKTINCFIKCSPKSGIPYEMANQIQSFSREVFMYETIVPKMQTYGINTINECLPQCYFQRPDDLMVFEDISLRNFRNVDALTPLNFDLLSLTVKKLARFHACSIVLEEKLSYRLIDHHEKHFTEQHFLKDENQLGSRMYTTGLKSIPVAIEQFPDLKTERNWKNFQKFWPKLQELFYTVSKTSDRYKNVLAHGDLWTSNLLVKFEGEKPIDCLFIDYQMIRYCPPAYDLLAVFYLTTHRSIRTNYEEKLTKMYYQELGSILETYGYSIDKFYLYQDLIDSIDYMRPQMLVFAAIECIMTMCTPEEISSLLTNEEESRRLYFEDRGDFLKKMCLKSKLYKNRLEECILDIYEYCNTMSEE